MGNFMFLYLQCKENKNNENRAKPENRSLVSEELVREVLRDYCARQELNIPDKVLAETVIERSDKGKPYFRGLSPAAEEGVSAIHFSVSHSGNWWGCLMGEEPVGFDMEVCREKVNYRKIAKRFFTEDECDLVLDAGPEVFFDLWVRKEAYVKYTGAGLAEGLNSFSVVVDGAFAAQIISGKRQQACFIRSCVLAEGVKAAYCSASGAPIKGVITLKQHCDAETYNNTTI